MAIQGERKSGKGKEGKRRIWMEGTGETAPK